MGLLYFVLCLFLDISRFVWSFYLYFQVRIIGAVTTWLYKIYNSYPGMMVIKVVGKNKLSESYQWTTKTITYWKDRRTDGQGESSLPSSNFVGRGYNNPVDYIYLEM